uniref:Exocyst subunit Exo70 family protein n=1 Tax=Oryza sativa subsp. japonica TaxID=39947 RepID=Q9FWH1_ORYSJ|nr:hypothetical protein [Oryza sativa Japonica Group]
MRICNDGAAAATPHGTGYGGHLADTAAGGAFFSRSASSASTSATATSPTQPFARRPDDSPPRWSPSSAGPPSSQPSENTATCTNDEPRHGDGAPDAAMTTKTSGGGGGAGSFALAESVAHRPSPSRRVLTMECVCVCEGGGGVGCSTRVCGGGATRVRAVVKTLLAGERHLCDELLASDEELGHEWFADVARRCLLQLIGFADAVAMSTPATEKLYRMLGMYEALTAVEPDIESLFTGDVRDLFSSEVTGVVAQLGNTIRHTMTIDQFVNVIHGESSRRPVHGGKIHPMTRYVLNYCGLLAECRTTLDMVLADNNNTNDDHHDGGGASSSGRCMRELLTHLLRKPDEKSRLYDHTGLQNIFLMNNLYCIVQKMMEEEEEIDPQWAPLFFLRE